VDRANNVTVFVNDTLGNEGYIYQEWNVSVGEVRREYNTPVAEGSTQDFLLNVSTSYSFDSVYLIYDDTAYESAYALNGDGLYEVSNTLIIPNVETATNITFYWSFDVPENSIVNTSSSNQTVTVLSIDDCSLYNVTIFNLTMVDENNQLVLNGSLNDTNIEIDLEILSSDGSVSFLQINQSYIDINPALICISENITETLLVNAIIRYESLDREQEFYHIQLGEITNTTIPQNITLFDLNSSLSTLFKINYKGVNFLPVADALILIQRLYVSEGEFKTVEIAKTDANGDAKGHFEIEGTIYTLTITKNGVTIDSFNEINVICENPLTEECTINLNSFDSNTDFDDWSTKGGVTYKMGISDDESEIVVDYISTSGLPVTVSVNSTKFGTSGVTVVCSGSQTSSAGQLVCPITDTYENTTLVTDLYVNDEFIVSELYSLGPSLKDTLGTDSYFFVFIILITIPFLFISSTIGMVIAIILGLLISMSLLLIETNGILTKGSAIVWLVIAGGVIIYKLARRDSL